MLLPTQEIAALFKNTPGAISFHEMLAIANIAAQAPADGIAIETGSNAGKSAISASVGLARVGTRDYYLIDPCYDLTNAEAWAHTCQGTSDNMGWYYVRDPDFLEKVRGRILTAGEGKITPHLVGDYSQRALPSIIGNIAYAFLDSDQHQYSLVMAECMLIKERLVKGGILAFHDFKNQFTGVIRAYKELLKRGGFEEVYVDVAGIRAAAVAYNGEKGNDSWHAQEHEKPIFVGALRKI